jgi:hypothetical protein
METRLLLKQMEIVRGWLLASPRGLSGNEILTVPRGSNNNILWNIGHVITDQCNMIYKPCGLSSPLPASYNAHFDPGTSPADWGSIPEIKDIEEVMSAGADMVTRIENDYAAGRFQSYAPMALDDGITLENFEAALSHCNLHEAMHIGAIGALRRLLTANRKQNK